MPDVGSFMKPQRCALSLVTKVFGGTMTVKRFLAYVAVTIAVFSAVIVILAVWLVPRDEIGRTDVIATAFLVLGLALILTAAVVSYRRIKASIKALPGAEVDGDGSPVTRLSLLDDGLASVRGLPAELAPLGVVLQTVGALVPLLLTTPA